MNIRQGDVMLSPVMEIKGNLIAKKEKILAYGEVTGHKHTLRGDAKFYENGDGQVLIEIGKEGAILEHEEHDNLIIPKGKYAVILQREFDIVEGVRQVMD